MQEASQWQVIQGRPSGSNGKLIQLPAQLDPDAILMPNDHHNLAVYAPGGLADQYLGVINIRAERFDVRGS